MDILKAFLASLFFLFKNRNENFFSIKAIHLIKTLLTVHKQFLKFSIFSYKIKQFQINIYLLALNLRFYVAQAKIILLEGKVINLSSKERPLFLDLMKQVGLLVI